jgi:2-polyprenyl-3-methyl-5-hydroxy-6-metoxy-1,4-benzoquinol methylase
VLDIGAGTGRDAGWFAAKGFDVIAVEPSIGMSSEGWRLHPNPRIRWVTDRLPDLDQVKQLGIAFDVVMLTAVWQHGAHRRRQSCQRVCRVGLRRGLQLPSVSRIAGAPTPQSR